MERAAAVLEASRLSEAELGEFLRRQGLHREQLAEWQRSLESALSDRGARRPSKEAKQIKDLERDLARKEKALAEAAALLVLKKKMDLLWAGEADATEKPSGR